MAVGRFEDGTPIVLSGSAGAVYTNDFVYKSPVAAKSLDRPASNAPPTLISARSIRAAPRRAPAWRTSASGGSPGAAFPTASRIPASATR